MTKGRKTASLRGVLDLSDTPYPKTAKLKGIFAEKKKRR